MLIATRETRGARHSPIGSKRIERNWSASVHRRKDWEIEWDRPACRIPGRF